MTFEEKRQVHLPKCSCRAGTYDKVCEFSNAPLHLYRHCNACDIPPISPLPRDSISRKEWKQPAEKAVSFDSRLQSLIGGGVDYV